MSVKPRQPDKFNETSVLQPPRPETDSMPVQLKKSTSRRRAQLPKAPEGPWNNRTPTPKNCLSECATSSWGLYKQRIPLFSQHA
eukprot:3863949-Amphidinium_carterae.1